jgi:hypothetical protein
VDTWKGNDLQGYWRFTRKIDGVKAIKHNDGRVVSRAGKPLYNLGFLLPGEYEIYRNNWETSVSLVRTQSPTQINPDDVYSIAYPAIDGRLDMGGFDDPYAALIRATMVEAIANGFEGLVLYGPDDQVLKVKPVKTYDVKVTGVISGKGKYLGKLGALITPMGNVGTGFTDLERNVAFGAWEHQTIEVECMGLTPNGKFRHPRFLRLRFDK